MSKVQNFPFNGRDRAQYRAFRQSILLVDLEAPVPDPAANAFLPALTTGGPLYLPAVHFGKPLKFLIPDFDQSDNPVPTFVEIRLTVDGTQDDPAHKFEDVTPLSPPPPIPMTLHLAAKDVQGAHRLSYTFDFGGNVPTVKSLEFMTDKVAPVLNTKIQLPQSVVDYGMGPEDFENGKTVKFTLPVYGNIRLGDSIQCFLGIDAATSKEVGTAITITPANIGGPLEFVVTATDVAAYDGELVTFCKAKSYPGVDALDSALTNVYVFKARRPIVLDQLHIPQIRDPQVDVLLIQDLIDKVAAGLENPFVNFSSATDKLVITIDGVAQPERAIPSFPIYIDLDNAGLIAQGENRDVTLGYRIKRGNFYFPATDIKRDVKLDVRKPAAPFDPADPNPPDKTLIAPTIQGPASTVPNVLTAADKQNGGDVTGSLPYHPRFKKDDVIQFYINGHDAPPPGGVVKLTGSEDTTKPIPFTFGWMWLDSIPDDPTAEFRVDVKHPTINANEAISLHSYLNKKTTPITLTEGGFLHMDPNPLKGFICSSLRKLPSGDVVGVVHIPGDSRLEGNEVTMTYAGYSAADGSDASEIPGTKHEMKHTPDQAQANSGFDLYLPYDPLLLTLNNWGRITYTVTIEGELVQTKGTVVRINMSLGTGSCDVTIVIPV